MKHNRYVLNFAFLFLSTFFINSNADDPSKTVRVTGFGKSVYEARQDAIRQALQMKVDQLVIEQRVVKNDRLVLDRIASTMNGYVTQFIPLKTRQGKNGVEFEAEIEISETRIENFIGSMRRNRAEIKPDNIAASIEALKIARAARGQVAAALFQDFPVRTIEVSSPKNLSTTPNDKLGFEVYIRWHPQFIKTLIGGLSAIGAQKIRCREIVVQGYYGGEDSNSCWGYPERKSLQVCFKEYARVPHGFPIQGFRSNLETGECWRLDDVDTQYFRTGEAGQFEDIMLTQGNGVTGSFSVALFSGSNTPEQPGFLGLFGGHNSFAMQMADGASSWRSGDQFWMTWEGGHVTMLFSTGVHSIKGEVSLGTLGDSAFIDSLGLMAIGGNKLVRTMTPSVSIIRDVAFLQAVALEQAPR